MKKIDQRLKEVFKKEQDKLEENTAQMRETINFIEKYSNLAENNYKISPKDTAGKHTNSSNFFVR